MASAALIRPLTNHRVLNLQNDRLRRRKEQQEALKEKLRDIWKQTPRYIYRAYSSSSSGVNTPFQISSKASALGQPSIPLIDLPVSDARAMIKSHLRWNYGPRDDLTSWTSSLLFALKRSIYARECGDSDINICMVDTWKTGLSGTTKFYNAATLLEIYEVPSEDKLQHHYYTAEYLTIGSVKLNETNSHVVLLENMIRDGLYNLAPHLSDRKGLWIPVNDIRMGEMFRQPSVLSAQDIENAKSLARNMSGTLYLAFFIALLSLQKREADDGLFIEVIIEAYLAGLDGDFFAGKDTLTGSARDVDVIEFAILCDRAHAEKPELIRRIHNEKKVVVTAEQELLPLMGNLSLNVHEQLPFDEDGDWVTDSSNSEALYFDSDLEAEEENMNDNIINLIEGNY